MAIVIIKQPVNMTASVGEAVTFTVLATGEGLIYQWQKKNDAASAWEPSYAGGATTNKLTLTVAAHNDGYSYRCIITDVNGNTVTTETAILTIGETIETESPVKITKHPEDVVALIDDTVIFTVEAEGNSLTYQWKKLEPAYGIWTDSIASGANSNTLTFISAASQNDNQYCCVITDSGGNTITSKVVTLKVSNGITITKQPQNYRGPGGLIAIFSVEAEGESLSYQWQWRADETKNWGAVTVTGSNPNTAALTIEATTARNGYQYRCVITDVNEYSVISENVILTIDNDSEFLIKPTTLSDISSAICEATGETITMKPTEMAARIRESFVALSVEQIDEIYNAAINSTTSIV